MNMTLHQRIEQWRKWVKNYRHGNRELSLELIVQRAETLFADIEKDVEHDYVNTEAPRS